MKLYLKMIKMLAAKNCYESGATVSQIAKDANVSESTVYEWLHKSGTRIRK